MIQIIKVSFLQGKYMNNTNKALLIYVIVLSVLMIFAMKNRSHEKEVNQLRVELEVRNCIERFQMSSDECFDMLREEAEFRRDSLDSHEHGSSVRFRN